MANALKDYAKYLTTKHGNKLAKQVVVNNATLATSRRDLERTVEIFQNIEVLESKSKDFKA